MYGLTRDFVRNGGTFMTLEKVNGLRMDELSRVQLGMLSSNPIPRMLPLYIREIDQNVTLQYDISGYKMLSQTLKSGRIRLQVLYHLLYQLVDALVECRPYMLESRNVWMHEEYIFIQGTMEQGELGLVYVPMMDERQKDLTPQLFRNMVTRLMAYVQELQGEGIQRLLQLCNDEQWDIKQLHELLLELSAGSAVYSGAGDHLKTRGEVSLKLNTAVPEQPQYNQRQPLIKLDSEIDESDLRANTFLQKRTVGQSLLGSPGYANLIQNSAQEKPPTFVYTEQENGGHEEENISASGSSHTTYVWLGCMVAIALIWRFIYMEQPGQNELILSVSLSLGLIAVASWIWKRTGRPRNRNESGVHKLFFIPVLGGKRDKQTEADEEMYQESWRWNTADSKSKEDKNKTIENFEESLAVSSVYKDSAPSHFGSRGNRNLTPFNTTREEEVDPMYTRKQGGESVMTSDLDHTGPAAEATVNLQQLAAKGLEEERAHEPKYYLERTLKKGERSERVEVKGASFVIGRASDMVQCVDSSTGVSRAHVELSRSQSGYVIKDLGSVNGTMLQGELLAPYKEYPLTDGDTFILADAVYIYRAAG